MNPSTRVVLICSLMLCGTLLPVRALCDDALVTLNQKADGYRGIWYMNQPSGDEYVYKYSGGLGTYCAKHQPFAIYCDEVDKTFFCYGGAAEENDRQLLHMVSYFDHQTKTVPRPTVLLDKQTDDAHDNPVISVDDDGYVWIFSTSHGTSRPSCIHRSTNPYDIDQFERVPAWRGEDGFEQPIENFSYMQVWHPPGQGFLCFFTRYRNPAARTSMFMSSADGVRWDSWQRLAAIDEGHYQISAVGRNRAGAAFNFHPKGKGLNWRTNLYYMETLDAGRRWQAADGTMLSTPLTVAANEALVHDYRAEGLNVYLKDLCFDADDLPIILFVTSRGYEAGPRNDPRTWATARWTGDEWEINSAFTSDNNYDMGSLWIEQGGAWTIIAPSEPGPQPYNPGGEVAMWVSRDYGRTWTRQRQMTSHSLYNHTYIRRPVGVHPDFYAFWADGHGRKPSPSSLYMCDDEGQVWRFPRRMTAPHEPLQPVRPAP